VRRGGTRQSNLLHQLLVPYRRLAAGRIFPRRRTTRDSRYPIVWQTTVVEFVPDQQVGSVALFSG